MGRSDYTTTPLVRVEDRGNCDEGKRREEGRESRKGSSLISLSDLIESLEERESLELRREDSFSFVSSFGRPGLFFPATGAVALEGLGLLAVMNKKTKD